MSWFKCQRQDFIRAQLGTYGMIRRKQIMAKFDVTQAVASADIAAFIDRHPNAIDYDRFAKCYTYEALATPARTDDAAQAGGDAAAMREAAAKVADRHADKTDEPSEFTDGYEDAAERIAAAIRALPLPTQEVEPAAEDRDFRAYVVKAGERLAQHSADPSGSPTRDALVWINAALHPHARKTVPLDYPIAPNVPAATCNDRLQVGAGVKDGLTTDGITQRDREDCAELWLMIGRCTAKDAQAIRAGEWDATKDLMWFAHRRATLATQAAYPTGAGEG